MVIRGKHVKGERETRRWPCWRKTVSKKLGDAMKVLLRCGLVAVLVATAGWASDEKKTEAQNNGLVGPVRTVSTQEGEPKSALNQTGWPVLLGIGGCKECEYDRQGTLTRSGQMVEGEFRGDRYQNARDERGNIVEQVRLAADGEVGGRTLYGPYGINEQSEYVVGIRVFHAEWRYDSNGNLGELVQYDRDDKIQTRTLRQTDASGNIKEEWCYGSMDELSYHTLDTYDPKTDVWTWTSYGEDGSVKVAIETQNGKVHFYRQNVNDPNVFGRHFLLDPIGNTQHSFRGNADGTYDDVTTIYPDEKLHNPERLEWRDGTGTLRLKVEYEYELDGLTNWTTRRTWVWTPDLGEKTLYKVDMRRLTYWGD